MTAAHEERRPGGNGTALTQEHNHPEGIAPADIAALTDDQLERALDLFDTAAHQGVSLPADPRSDDLRTLAARLRIEQRNRQARSNVDQAHRALLTWGGARC